MLKFLHIPIVIILFCNFGKYSHRIINNEVVTNCKKNKTFNEIFCNREKYFIDNAAKPDERKLFCYQEKSKHFFNPDAYHGINFTKFISKEELYKNVSKQLKKTNCERKINPIEKYIQDHGYLPWAIIETIENLKSLMNERKLLINKKDLETIDKKIIENSINLTHYIADMCTPLHATIYHDGRNHNQKGIHKFWETLIPSLYANKYTYKINNNLKINDIKDFIFNYIQNTNKNAIKILKQEEILCKQYKLKNNNESLKKRFSTRKYASFCSKYFNKGINKQMNDAISITTYIFNNIIFVN